MSINGIDYEVRNTADTSNTLLYSVNPVTGIISFSGVRVDITGQKDAVHNVDITEEVLLSMEEI